MNQIGIMQGRLSPRPKHRLQTFPWNCWQEEFQLARNCGFDTIEWLFEADEYRSNPLWTNEVGTIERLIAETGVKVNSVCADYFMQNPLFVEPKSASRRNVAVLNELIEKSARIGVRVILIPVLEISELRTESDRVRLLENLQAPLRLAEELNIKIGLETELPADEYRILILQGNHEALGVYYDSGNAAAKAYDIASDIRELGPLTCGIHIKDRKRGGASVRLGQGDAKFKEFFQTLKSINYEGPLVLQTAFGDDHVGDAKSQLAFVRSSLSPDFALADHT